GSAEDRRVLLQAGEQLLQLQVGRVIGPKPDVVEQRRLVLARRIQGLGIDVGDVLAQAPDARVVGGCGAGREHNHDLLLRQTRRLSAPGQSQQQSAEQPEQGRRPGDPSEHAPAACSMSHRARLSTCSVVCLSCPGSPRTTCRPAVARSSTAPAAVSRATDTKARPSGDSKPRSGFRGARSSTTSATRNHCSSRWPTMTRQRWLRSSRNTAWSSSCVICATAMRVGSAYSWNCHAGCVPTPTFAAAGQPARTPSAEPRANGCSAAPSAEPFAPTYRSTLSRRSWSSFSTDSS